MENTYLRRINIFSVIAFVLSLLPIAGAFYAVNNFDLKIATGFGGFLMTYLFNPVLVYVVISIVLSIMSLITIRKTNEKGKLLSYTSIILSVLTGLVYLYVITKI